MKDETSQLAKDLITKTQIGFITTAGPALVIVDLKAEHILNMIKNAIKLGDNFLIVENIPQGPGARDCISAHVYIPINDRYPITITEVIDNEAMARRNKSSLVISS